MSLFRFAKYSTILFFLGKYKAKIFRVVAVLLFAAVTSLLYQDVAEFLHREHPGTVIYALVAKIIIVYGALVFVLWQFRPQPDNPRSGSARTAPANESETLDSGPSNDRLSQLENIGQKDRLTSRYDKILQKDDSHTGQA
jgi:hypothetical protein